MRKAILIGVSEYENCNNLPGCDKDVEAISELLNSSKEFNEVKVFSKNVLSDMFKSELSKMFEEWKGQNVEEVFFYFSGHGSFINNEFYYILSDFDESQKRQTSLQNLEIDRMIKSIKPKMVTKVIDACQSGVSYIKANTNLAEKYYQKTAENFDKCYFLHSSMSNQYSYQDNILSDFTKSFLKAISTSNKPFIRYKDIMDFISDEFENSTDQTPFFVTQATYTEQFLNIPTDLKKLIAKYTFEQESEPEAIKIEQAITYNSFIDRIKKEAEIYSTQEDASNLLYQIEKQITEFDLQSELNEIYNFKFSFEHNLRNLPKVNSIARWLENNPNDFFAKSDYEQVSYQEEEAQANPFGIMSRMMRGNKIVTKYRSELRGFEQSIDTPFKFITLDLVPIYPNLRQYTLLVTFVISKKDIKFFNAFTEYNDIDWNRREIIKNFKWDSSIFLIKDIEAILEFISKIMFETELKVLEIIKNKFDEN